MTEASLSWLLAPMSSEEFFERIWGVKHHAVRRDRPEYFNGLFGAQMLEDFLQFARPEYTAVQLVRTRDGQTENHRLPDGSVDLVRVRNDFNAGYTVVLNGLERYLPSIAALSHALEVETNFETQVNAYITPPESQGLAPHYDSQDIFILQIAGSKTWYLYPGADVANHELHRRPKAPVKSWTVEVLVNAGDVLYVPRGRVHTAQTHTDEPSIHLTVGVGAPTVLSLLTQALEALRFRDDRVLDRLPVRYLSDAATRVSLGALVEGVVQALNDPDVLADGVGRLEDALVRRGRCWHLGELVSKNAGTECIDVSTRVSKLRPLYSRVLPMDGGVALQFGHSFVKAAADHQAAMQFLSRVSEPFRVGDVPELSSVQQVDLARKLIADGFLVRLPDT